MMITVDGETLFDRHRIPHYQVHGVNKLRRHGIAYFEIEVGCTRWMLVHLAIEKALTQIYQENGVYVLDENPNPATIAKLTDDYFSASGDLRGAWLQFAVTLPNLYRVVFE